MGVSEDHACAICSEGQVAVVADFSGLNRVASDCRPFDAGGTLAICNSCGLVQKPLTDSWLSDIGGIYARYDMFRQAEGGDEQLVFVPSTGEPMRRSFAVLKQLTDISAFSHDGRAIDVGCGNGAMLKAISRFAPGWSLSGTEQSDATLLQLQDIKGFERLYGPDLATVPGPFDLMTLSHSLEHFVMPAQELATTAELLSSSGLLIAQVPDCAKNLYDILVADHRSHFTAETLATCARRAGLEHFVVTDRLVPKELTLIASKDSQRIAPFGPISVSGGGDTVAHVDEREMMSRVTWLSSVQQAAREAATDGAPFGIFGTSIAGTWVFGGLQAETKFFVDEDISRVGKRHEERPIVAPKDIAPDTRVFLCLIPEIAAAVEARLAPMVAGRLVLPPPYEI
jgi:hypothetical protein